MNQKTTLKSIFLLSLLMLFSEAFQSFGQAGRVLYQRPNSGMRYNSDTNRIKHKNFGIGLVPLSTFGSGMEIAGNSFGKKYNARLSLGLFTATNPFFYGRFESFGDTEVNFMGFKVDGMIKKILPVRGKYLVDVGLFTTFRYGRLDIKNTQSTGAQTIQTTRISEAGAIIAGPVVGIYRMFDDVWYVGADIGTGLLFTVYDNDKNDLHIPVVSPFQSGAQLKANFTIGFQL